MTLPPHGNTTTPALAAGSFGSATLAHGRPRWSRYFFAGIGGFCILLAVLGFAPNLYRYFSGRVYYPPVVHIHAAIMLAWTLTFTVQAALIARGAVGRHRWVGRGATVLAAIVWLSMLVASIAALQRYDPARFGFIVKPLLVQIGQLVVFPVFVTWAICARRHADWHKRLMTLATFVLIQAALDRMHWLPNEGLPMFWHSGVRLYVLLLLPLAVFDIATLRRVHPATWIGSALIVAMHGAITFYWDHPGWDRAAHGFWMWLRQTH